MEALLSGTLPAASPTTATAQPNLLPNGFADLLSLLGVTPIDPDNSDADASLDVAPKPSAASSQPNLKAAPAAPEDIAAAVIRAMLTPAPQTTVVAPAESQAAEPAPVNPAVVTARPGPKEEPRENEHPVPLEVAPNREPAPDVVPLVPPAPSLPLPVPVPIESAVPCERRSGDPVLVGDKLTSVSIAEPHAPPALPPDPTPLLQAPEHLEPAAPVAFALRLTPAEPEIAKPAAKPEPRTILAPPQPVRASSSSQPAEPALPHVEPAAAPHDPHQAPQDHEQPKERAEQPKAERPAPPASEFKPAANTSVPPPTQHAELTPVRAEAPVTQESVPTTKESTEVLTPQPELPRGTTSAHEIAVRVSSSEASPVDVHVTQRGGEVRVAVRTADDTMQTSLRQDLGKLVDRLEQTGFRTETVAVDAGAPKWDRAAYVDSLTVPVHRAFETGRSEFSGQGSEHEQHGRESDFGQQGSRQQQQQQQRRQQRQLKQSWEDFQ